MRSATKIGCAAAAALICAGSAAAALPVPQEPLPLPPSALPALPVPAPQPPAAVPPLPTLPPAPPVPAAPVPVAPSVAAPAAPTVGAGPSAPATGSGLDGRTSSADQQAEAGAARTAAGPSRAPIRPGKVRRAGRDVSIGYGLARAGRVFVVVRGPVPDCAVVSRFSVRGERGANALRFNGKVGRKRLKSGSYLIGLRTSGSTVRWTLLAVTDDAVRPVRKPAAPAVLACTAPVLSALLVSSEVSSSGTASSPPRAAAPPTAEPPSLDETPRASVLPFAGVEDAVGELPAAAGPLLLLLLLGSLAAVGTFVVRFLRAS